MKAPLALALTCSLLACATSTKVAPTSAAGTNTASCTERPTSDTTVYDTAQITRRPELRQYPVIHYPSGPLAMNIQGRVEQSLVINADGSVDSSSVQILTHVDRLLDAEAVRAAKGVWYEPACRGAEAVRVRVVVPIEFRIARGQ